MCSNKTNKKNIELYTDGSSLGNPGAGGWASILEYGEIQKRYSQAELKMLQTIKWS